MQKGYDETVNRGRDQNRRGGWFGKTEGVANMARFVRNKVVAAIVAAAALMFATSTAAGASEASDVAPGDVAATAAATAEAIAPAAEKAAVDVECTGNQDEIDTCVGATNYEPISDYLGVPYYAQHNGMGGEAWLSLEVGDLVAAEGVTYTIVEIRTVETGGASEQIEGMEADAYLQTCLDDNVHSNVYALKVA